MCLLERNTFKRGRSAVPVTLDKDLNIASTGNVEAAKAVGAAVAKRALEKNITSVVFDRGGYIYHGRVAALAEAARENGLQF